jgi:hypothetical protein
VYKRTSNRGCYRQRLQRDMTIESKLCISGSVLLAKSGTKASLCATTTSGATMKPHDNVTCEQ